jgi:hypothetical protein
MRQLLIERDDDCDCPKWLRWRLVERVVYEPPDVRHPGVRLRSVSETVLAHSVTKLGARWKRRRLGFKLPGLFRA